MKVPPRKGTTPALWLFGPPGVGKTAVAWEIYQRLGRDGLACAYVDIDQLGMLYPESTSDPGRHRLKERNLDTVVANFARAGARGVVISGVVDPSGVALGELGSMEMTLCRLRADPDQLRERLRSRRGSQPGIVENALREAEILDGSGLAVPVVDTTGLGIDEAAQQALDVSRWAPARAFPGEGDGPDGWRSSAGGRIVWLCGPRGVGKSTIGFTVFRGLLQTGFTAGYIDTDQIGFSAVALHDPWLRARNLAAIWENYRSSGGETLVVVGPARDGKDISVYEAMLPEASFHWFRLHAGPRELAKRIRTRQQGGSWPQPGDLLRDASDVQVEQAATEAAAEAVELDGAAIGVGVDTDGLSIEESASVILHLLRDADAASAKEDHLGRRASRGGGDRDP